MDNDNSSDNSNDHIENENNEKNENSDNKDFNMDFLNNISEELQAEMRMIQSYNNIGKMVGSFYSGLLDSVDFELATKLTETFISSYVYNLFNSFGGERK